MSDAFVASPCKGFKQSGCRARVTKAGGLFVFQQLQCNVIAHNSDGTPWGSVAGQDPNTVWPDAGGATFFGPAPIAGFGGTSEFWKALTTTTAGNPVLQRAGPVVNPIFFQPGTKKTFSWQFGFDISGPVIKTRLITYRAKSTYLAFTAPSGQMFPGGQYEDRVDRMKIFPAASGTTTYHTLTFDGATPPFFGSCLALGGAPFTVPLWHRQVYQDTGTTVQEFSPDGVTIYQKDFTSVTPPFGMSGTLEVAIFWFERKPSDLPTFPYLFDPSVP